MLKKYKIIIFVLTLMLFGLIFRVVLLREKYRDTVEETLIWEYRSNLEYIVNTSSKSRRMYIGDLLGVNPSSRKYVEKIAQRNNFDGKVALLGYKKAVLPVNEYDFLQAISNDRGVIVPDNFCISEWDMRVSDDQLYQDSLLSAGDYCFSEKESREISNLFRANEINEVILYFDIPEYKNFTKIFQKYLTENNISYEFKQVPK